MSTFGERFKMLRESRGWTQEQAAEVLKVSRPTVAGYESSSKGRVPRSEMLQRVAEIFGVTVDFLLGRDDGADETHLDEETVRNIEMFLADIEGLPLEALAQKYALRLDGRAITSEEWEGAVAYIRARRMRP